MGLEIEGGASLKEKGRFHHLKLRRIGSTERDGVDTKNVIADNDIGHLDRTATGGVFRQRWNCVGERHRRWRLVLVRDHDAYNLIGATNSPVDCNNADNIDIVSVCITGCIEVWSCDETDRTGNAVYGKQACIGAATDGVTEAIPFGICAGHNIRAGSGVFGKVNGWSRCDCGSIVATGDREGDHTGTCAVEATDGPNRPKRIEDGLPFSECLGCGSVVIKTVGNNSGVNIKACATESASFDVDVVRRQAPALLNEIVSIVSSNAVNIG